MLFNIQNSDLRKHVISQKVVEKNKDINPKGDEEKECLWWFFNI